MSLDWTHFTPWTALAGGAVIGLAAALLVAVQGRVLGISGIVSGLLDAAHSDKLWRLSLLLGLLVSPLLWHWAAPSAWQHLPRIEAGWGALVAAGVLVGLGTRMAGGCTSGHGVCGLSRLSLRSLVATLCFMASGMATVWLVRHGGF